MCLRAAYMAHIYRPYPNLNSRFASTAYNEMLRIGINNTDITQIGTTSQWLGRKVKYCTVHVTTLISRVG